MIMVMQRKQSTVTRDKQETDLTFRGRQEPCVAIRGLYQTMHILNTFYQYKLLELCR